MAARIEPGKDRIHWKATDDFANRDGATMTGTSTTTFLPASHDAQTSSINRASFLPTSALSFPIPTK
ncbi:hypothetical protein CF328_g7829 [Tilletia controversa]|nr:hypothetical protein CF328_g7829 [Tilletia controversa]KAE8186135.1 hypothetical protein CF335_g7534 [Tilletia laevis]